MATYKPTIGLEIHAELKTATKMFCNSKNDPDETRPNVNVCPVCMGHPGTLPTINKEAVRHVLRVGLAVGGTLADYSEFDRKNYFYPDIPKGYQISQYKYPLVSGGTLNGVQITRVHLEEDTARSIHADDKTHSLVDFNRAGVPLMELVTEPVIRSAEEAAAFAQELQLLLRILGVSDANMEQGQMRVEANISVSSGSALGTKTEVKNLNSFKSVERAIMYEIERQIVVLESGKEVEHETRGWDENKQQTFSQRKKEYSHDYRYFPEPDLPKLMLGDNEELGEKNLRATLPELPTERRARYTSLGLKKEDVEMLVRDTLLGDFFERATTDVKTADDIILAANYLVSDVVGLVSEIGTPLSDAHLSADAFRIIIGMVRDGELSSRGAKDLLRELFVNGGDAKDVAEKKGLLQKSDADELRKVVKTVIEQNENVVNDFKNGKESALQFLIGQAMRVTRGSGNPLVLKEIFVKELK